MSKPFNWGILPCPCSNPIVFIIIGFTNWDLWSFSQGDLLQDCSEQWSCTACHVSLLHHRVLKLGPLKLNFVLFLEHLQEFHLEVCIPSYRNSPQVSCLGMNSGKGWNPNLEGSYLPRYSEYEVNFWTQCSSGFYIRYLQFSASAISPISEYSDGTKTYQF